MRFLIRYKELTDLENKWLRIWCSYAAFLYQFIMDFSAQVKDFLPTTSNDEVVKDENVPADNIEVVHTALSTSNLLQDTGDYTITLSNVDQTVSNDDKSDSTAIDDSKTREFPDVLLDNVLSEGIVSILFNLVR